MFLSPFESVQTICYLDVKVFFFRNDFSENDIIHSSTMQVLPSSKKVVVIVIMFGPSSFNSQCALNKESNPVRALLEVLVLN